MSLRERIAAMIAESARGFQETSDITPDACLDLADDVIAQVRRDTTVSVDDAGRQVLTGMATVTLKGKISECGFDLGEFLSRPHVLDRKVDE